MTKQRLVSCDGPHHGPCPNRMARLAIELRNNGALGAIVGGRRRDFRLRHLVELGRGDEIIGCAAPDGGACPHGAAGLDSEHVFRLDGLRPAKSCHRPAVAPTGSRLFSVQTWEGLEAALRLSPTEVRVAQYVMDDLPERTIARRLHVEPSTVHTHLKRIYSKLGVSSRVGLIMRIFEVVKDR